MGSPPFPPAGQEYSTVLVLRETLLPGQVADVQTPQLSRSLVLVLLRQPLRCCLGSTRRTGTTLYFSLQFDQYSRGRGNATTEDEYQDVLHSSRCTFEVLRREVYQDEDCAPLIRNTCSTQALATNVPPSARMNGQDEVLQLFDLYVTFFGLGRVLSNTMR